MAAFNFFSTRFGAKTEIYSVQRDWTRWIGLNENINVLPVEINLHKEYPDRDWANEQTLPSGRYKDADWAYEPDWFRLDTWWRGWIPVAATDDFSPWYLDLDSLDAYVTVAGNCFAFPDDKRERMQNNIGRLQTAVDLLIEERILGVYLSGPPVYDHSILDGTFDTVHELRIESANAKRAALDRVGWIRWWVKACPDGYDSAPGFVKSLLHEGLNELYASRGHVVDLGKDWGALDFPF